MLGTDVQIFDKQTKTKYDPAVNKIYQVILPGNWLKIEESTTCKKIKIASLQKTSGI